MIRCLLVDVDGRCEYARWVRWEVQMGVATWRDVIGGECLCAGLAWQDAGQGRHSFQAPVVVAVALEG
jgi:hypothetical protein